LIRKKLIIQFSNFDLFVGKIAQFSNIDLFVGTISQCQIEQFEIDKRIITT
jgi:hypothetical protein